MAKERKETLGRPTKYSDELAALICNRVATSTLGLPALCALHDDMPAQSTINVWRFEKKTFSDKYAEAKRFQAELIAENLIELCHVDSYEDDKGVVRVDTGLVARQKLLVDTVKWHASKLAPKIYGDKQQSDSTVTVKHESDLKALS